MLLGTELTADFPCEARDVAHINGWGSFKMFPQTKEPLVSAE